MQKKATKFLQAAGLRAVLGWGDTAQLAAELQALEMDDGVEGIQVRVGGGPLSDLIARA